MKNFGNEEPVPKSEKMEVDSEYMCVICRKNGTALDEAPIGIIALATVSGILGI